MSPRRADHLANEHILSEASTQAMLTRSTPAPDAVDQMKKAFKSLFKKKEKRHEEPQPTPTTTSATPAAKSSISPLADTKPTETEPAAPEAQAAPAVAAPEAGANSLQTADKKVPVEVEPADPTPADPIPKTHEEKATEAIVGAPGPGKTLLSRVRIELEPRI